MGHYLETFKFLAKLIERLFNLEENFKDAHGQERCFVGAFQLCTFIKVKDVNLRATLVCDFWFWEKRRGCTPHILCFPFSPPEQISSCTDPLILN